MAEQFMDFEAMADQAGDDAPKFMDAPTKKGSKHLDFEALADVPGAGALLANHRWASTRDIAKERKAKLEQATKVGAVPTGEGMVGLDALTTSSWKADRPKNPNTLAEAFGRELTPEPVTSAGSFARNAARDAAGLGIGTLDIAQLATRGIGTALTGNTPKGMEQLAEAAKIIGGGIKFGVQGPASILGAYVQSKGIDILIPAVRKFLEATGTTQEDFYRMGEQNPVGLITSLLPFLPKGVKGLKGFEPEMPLDETALHKELTELAQAQQEHAAKQANGDVVTPDQSRMGQELEWRDRVQQLQAEQDAARTIETPMQPTQPGELPRAMGPLDRDPAVNLRPQDVEAARQQALIDQSGGKILDERGRPRYIAAGDAPPEGAVAAGNQAGFNKAQFEGDLASGAVEPTPPNLASEGFKGWSMERGFDAAPETLEWINTKDLNKGFDLTQSEINIRAKRALDNLRKIERSQPDRLARPKGKKGILGDQRGSIDPQVFQDIYDLGAHFAGKAKNFAEWSSQMVKNTGIRSIEVLKHLWEQVKQVVSFKRMTDDQVRMAEYQARYPDGYLTPPEVFKNSPEYLAKKKSLRESIRGPEVTDPQLAREMGDAFKNSTYEAPTKFGPAVDDPNVRPLHERRVNAPQRQAISDRVKTLREAKAKFSDVIQDNLDSYRSGKIGPIEYQAAEREAMKQYRETMASVEDNFMTEELSDQIKADTGNSIPLAAYEVDPTVGEYLADLDKLMDAQARSRKPIPREGEGFSFGPLKNEPGGTNLGMMGGQELYNRTVEAAKMLGKAVDKSIDTFDAWAAEVRLGGAKAGVSFTDDQLRAAWNSSEVRKQPSEKAALKAIATAVGNGTVEGSGQRFAGKALFDKARALADNNFSDARKAEWADNILNEAEDVWLARFGASPSLSRVRAYAPRMYEAASRVSTAKGLAYIKTRNVFNALDKILGSKGMRNAFADLINDDRARALLTNRDAIAARKAALPAEIEAAKKAGNQQLLDALQAELDDISVPPETTIPTIPDEQRMLLLQDPRIQKAVKYWQEQVVPSYEALSNEAGITRRLNGPLGLYNRMRWVDVETAAKEQLRDRELTRPATAGGRSSPFDVRPRPSASARKATGVGPRGTSPENSLFHMIHATYEARIPSIAVAELRNQIIANAEATASGLKASGLKPPQFKRLGGRVEPLSKVTLEFGPGLPSETYYVPQLMASAYDTVMAKETTSKAARFWNRAANTATVQTLMLPAEATNHAINVMQIMTTLAVKKVPGVGAAPEAALAAFTLGGSRVAMAIARGINKHGPEFGAQLEGMADGGALRLSGFEGFGAENKNVFLHTVENLKVPGIGFKPIKALKDSVFADPGSNRGIRGGETRLRAVLWDLLKEEHPNASNVELGRMVNESMGTYIKELAPPIAKALMPLDPFVRAGIAATRTGLRATVGIGPSGKFSPWNLAATYGTLIATQYYSSKLDDKGRWPIQIAGWKPTYIAYFERNGKMYSFGLRDILGPLSRAARFTGATGVVESLRNGNDLLSSETVFNMAREHGNFWLGRMGPFIRTIPHLFGKEPYMLVNGSFLSGEKPAMEGAKTSRLVERAKLVAGGLVPWAGKLKDLIVHGALDPTGEFDEGEAVLPENHLARVLYYINEFFKLPAPTLRQPNPIERPVKQYGTEKAFDDVIADITRRARNKPQAQRSAFIQREIDAQLSNDIVSQMGIQGPAKAIAMQIIMRRLGSAPASAAKGMAIQNINAGQ